MTTTKTYRQNPSRQKLVDEYDRIQDLVEPFGWKVISSGNGVTFDLGQSHVCFDARTWNILEPLLRIASRDIVAHTPKEETS